MRKHLDADGKSRPGDVVMIGNYVEDDLKLEGRRTFVASCGNVFNLECL